MLECDGPMGQLCPQNAFCASQIFFFSTSETEGIVIRVKSDGFVTVEKMGKGLDTIKRCKEFFLGCGVTLFITMK